MGGQGGIRGGKKKGVLRLACMGGGRKGRVGCTTQRGQVGILQHFAKLMDSNRNVVVRGDLI